MNRRALINVVIGAIATFAALTTIVWLRQGRCEDAGGRWDAAARACGGPAARIAVEQGSDIVAGLLVGLVLAFMLYRISTFSSRKR